MSKKGIIIAIVVLVFLVIGVTVYLIMSSNKKPTETVKETTTNSNGLSNLIAQSGGFGGLGSLIKLF